MDKNLRAPLFEFIRFCLRSFIHLTMGRVYRLFGIPPEGVGLFHAEVYLVCTTALFISLIFAAHFWWPLGWAIVILGNIRLLQIVSLNLSTLIFSATPLSDSIAVEKRARWHFVAISFSLLDALLIFGFLYEFLDRRYGILNRHFEDFLSYFYFSTMTFFKNIPGEIYPVTPLGKFMVMYEAATAFFFLVFLISGALGRLRQNAGS